MVETKMNTPKLHTRHKRVTLSDVALRAGVRVDAASKVLNGTRSGTHISPENRVRIEEAARELGYFPNLLARAMKPEFRINTIGVMLPPKLIAPHTSRLLESIIIAADEQELRLMLLPSRSWKNAQESLPELCDGRIEGLLVFFQQDHQDSMIPALQAARMPLVVVNDIWDDPQITCIDIDNVGIGYQATKYLLGLGHRRILLLMNRLVDRYTQDRIKGYEQACAEVGVTPFGWETGVVAWEHERARDMIKRQMEGDTGERPTALLCNDDNTAATIASILHSLNYRIPEDISLMGVNNDGAANSMMPSLTTVRQPYAEIARRSIESLVAQIEGKADGINKTLLQTELVVRDSTAPLL